jgi:hypothetical protein
LWHKLASAPLQAASLASFARARTIAVCRKLVSPGSVVGDFEVIDSERGIAWRDSDIPS